MRSWSPLLLLALPLGTLSGAAEAAHPAGASIPDAATIDLTPEGLQVVTDILPGLLPGDIAVPAISDGARTGFPQCLLGGYEYEVSGVYVDFEVASASIVPNTGRLDLEITLLVGVNSPSDPFYLHGEVECIGTSCDGYVDPFYATVTTELGLRVIPDPTTGEPTLDATVGDLDLSYTLTGANIHLDNCFIGTVEDVLNWFGLSIYDLILSLAAPYIDGLLGDFAPEIETLLEDTFSSLQLNEELDVNGILLAAQLAPSDVAIDPNGVRIYMDGSMSTDTVASCIQEYDPSSSLETATDPPVLGSAPAGIPTGYHAALNLSDDFGNQALYSLWRGGLLCYQVDEELVGFALDTGLLNSLADGSFDDLFPSPSPMVIQTRPAVPPTLVFDGDNDLGLNLEQLGLDFYADLDGRESRIVAIDIDMVAGADLEFDGTTGNLGVVVDLGTDALTATVTDNEFKPGTEAAIQENFAGLFDTLLGSLVGGLLGDLSFALPSFTGLGLTDLALEGAGDQGDWLGGYAWLGTVSYGAEAGGCDDTGGCSGGARAAAVQRGACCSSPCPWPWSPCGAGATKTERRAGQGRGLPAGSAQGLYPCMPPGSSPATGQLSSSCQV